VVRLADGTKLVNPTVQQLAERLHLHAHPNAAQYDLAIVGAGPAGLTAGIYGASEGLSTVVIDSQGFGGQAGSSSRIENYPGFPDGISGHDLTQREVRQAQRLGAELITLNGVDKIEQAGEDKLVHLSDGSSIHAKAVVVASGLQPRPLKIDGADRLADAGIYYGAGSEEVTNASGKHVIIVGGANSAGQAAVNFADHGATVDILVRGSSIDKDMSAYLIDQIKQRGQIRVHPNTEVMQVEGDARLHQVQVRNNSSGGSATMPADSMLVFIGSAPNTEWCDIAHDAQGYILSGPDLGDRWTLPGPPPFENETSMPGVFTAGDVQHGEVHRVATAVGSGAGTVSQVHRYLATRKSN
jgi:thioredoxin reductase (NADPH)